MTEEQGETSNLRLLPVAEPDEEKLLDKRKPSDQFCRHRQATIDETAHRLYCRDCGDELDPLDFLTDLASRWDHVQRDRDSMKAKARLVGRELADAERRLKNAKARLRKQGVELETADARRALEQLRALGRALPNLLHDVLGDDFSEARRKAEQTAKLCGYRQEDATKAVKALSEALDAVTVRRSG